MGVAVTLGKRLVAILVLAVAASCHDCLYQTVQCRFGTTQQNGITPNDGYEHEESTQTGPRVGRRITVEDDSGTVLKKCQESGTHDDHVDEGHGGESDQCHALVVGEICAVVVVVLSF